VSHFFREVVNQVALRGYDIDTFSKFSLVLSHNLRFILTKSRPRKFEWIKPKSDLTALNLSSQRERCVLAGALCGIILLIAICHSLTPTRVLYYLSHHLELNE